MDRWDWIWLNLLCQLAIAERIPAEECNAEWDSYAPLM
jgi:hypothetical protein